MKLAPVLEGLLFINGSDGLSFDDMKDILDIDDIELERLIESLESEYSNPKRGIKLVKLGNKYKLATKEEHKEYYERLSTIEDNNNLSQSLLETLAIIAYNQPITRIKVDEIRGVSSSYSIRKLLSKNLIKEVGKSELPGRPNLYSVTSDFLDYLGLSSIEELPALDDKEELDDEEADLFSSRYKEN